mgnify:CR=1 FL=1
MRYIILALSASIIAFTSCNNTQKQAEGSNADTAQHAEHSGEHIFACPMHPEVTGKEGDKCSKCGMKLVHNDNAGKGNGQTYRMHFTSNPSPIEAGKPTVLSMTPQIVGKEKELVPLDIEHEKKIHFIMVSEDLSWFDHQHPEYTAAGTYDLPYTFKQGGKYILYADYKPAGANHSLETIHVDVKGKTPAAKTYSKPQLVSESGEFEVTLSPANGNRIESGSVQHIKGVIRKNGQVLDANTLENYLGAKAHMVVVGLEDKNYLHVHPGVENGQFDLHTTFDKPGIYRAWIQYQSAGKIYTSDFVIKVEQGDSDAHAGHTHQ